MMIWQEWQEDYVLPLNDVVTAVENQLPVNDADVAAVDIPVVAPAAIAEGPPASINTPILSNSPAVAGEVINVKTDVFDIQINTLGGTVQHLALNAYPVAKDQQDKPIILLKNRVDDFYLFQGGLIGAGAVANHKTLFSSEQSHYELNSDESLAVPLVWESGDGIKVIKTFTFYKGQYVADVNYQISNGSYEDWKGN